MNKRIKINGKLYEAVSTTDVNDIPSGWSSEVTELGSSVVYHFRNKKLQLDVYVNSIDEDDVSVTVQVPKNPTAVYHRDRIESTINFNGLLKAVERGTDEMMDVVSELAPGTLFTMINSGNYENTRNLKAAMKYVVDREINRW